MTKAIMSLLIVLGIIQIQTLHKYKGVNIESLVYVVIFISLIASALIIGVFGL